MQLETNDHKTHEACAVQECTSQRHKKLNTLFWWIKQQGEKSYWNFPELTVQLQISNDEVSIIQDYYKKETIKFSLKNNETKSTDQNSFCFAV